MAASPGFAATPRLAAGSVSTANTNRDGTGTIATIFTAGASGSVVERIFLKATADPADSTVVLYLHDGTNFFAWKEVDLGNPAAGSATVATYEYSEVVNLPLPTSWSIRASITAALTGGVVNVIVSGGDL